MCETKYEAQVVISYIAFFSDLPPNNDRLIQNIANLHNFDLKPVETLPKFPASNFTHCSPSKYLNQITFYDFNLVNIVLLYLSRCFAESHHKPFKTCL